MESGRTSGPICMQLPSETLLVLWQSLSVEHAPWTIKGMTQSACSTRKAGGICPGLPRCSVGIAFVRETLKIIYEKSKSEVQQTAWALGIIGSALVRLVLRTYGMPGKINHVHFLTAMIADHIKRGPSVTSADMTQITREALVPRAQAIVGTTTSSRRGWLQHDKETSRIIVRMAARPNQGPSHRAGERQSLRLGEGQGH